MEIKSAADAATVRARSDWFTGTVWQDPLLEAPDPARVKVVRVTFEPGARTAWHTHPLGQTLHVITGVGPGAARLAAIPAGESPANRGVQWLP